MHTEARVVRAKRKEELDKRISMVVKVINSQVWPSYCPALYPPTVWRRLDYHVYVYTGYIYLLNELYSLSKQILRRFDGVILVDPLCAVGANFFLRAMDRYEVQRGTIRLRNREEHANENSRSVSIDRRIVLLINAITLLLFVIPFCLVWKQWRVFHRWWLSVNWKNEKMKKWKKKNEKTGIFYKICVNYAQCTEFRNIVFIWIGFTIR